MTPVLSIIVPVYNVEEYIQQCLESIVQSNASSGQYEVIIVNDGTRDDSMTIVDEFAHSYDNFYVINQENAGLSSARNTGLSAARGEYIWFIDSDDWLKVGAVDTVLFSLKSNYSLDIITTPLYWAYDDHEKDFVDINVNADMCISGIEYVNFVGLTGASVRNIVRKKLLEDHDIRFFPGILHEDGLWGPQVFYLAKSVLVLKNFLYVYRQRGSGSIMHSRTIKSGYDLITVHKQLMKFCDDVVSPEHRRWFRQKNINVLYFSISFTWHLRHTKEFRCFISKTRKYRLSQSFLCMINGGFVGVPKSILYGFSPFILIVLKGDKQ